MAVRKPDAYKALQQLTQLRESTNEEVLIQDIDRLIEVMQSKLFVALLEVQEFFEQRFVSKKSQNGFKSQRSSRKRRDSSQAELEWEESFEFSSGHIPGVMDDGREDMETTEEVTLPADPSSIGLSITGGVDRPYSEKNTSIFVTGLVPGSRAERSGRIFPGDKLVSVNNESCENRLHHEVVQMLRSPKELKLVVIHNALQLLRARDENVVVDAGPTTITVDLHRVNGGLGFTIAGGKHTPHVADDDGIFITKIIPGGAAYEDGRLAVGDKITSVGGRSISGWIHDDVVHKLQGSEEVVILGIEKNAYQRTVSVHDRRSSQIDQISRAGSSVSLQRPSSDYKAINSSNFPKRHVPIHPTAKGSLGMAIVGPSSARSSSNREPFGIFISSISDNGPAQNSGGLQEGDQILAVNGIDLRNATYVQATETIRANCKSVIQLEVQANPSMYALYKAKMAKLPVRSSNESLPVNKIQIDSGKIYIRALFDYDPGSDTGLSARDTKRTLLKVQIGAVFALLEWKSNKDWWQIKNVHSNEQGWIPSPQRWERLHGHTLSGKKTHASAGTDAARGGQRKRSRSFRFARRLSLSRRRKSRGSASSSSGTACYEIVELRQQTSELIRPVILLGPSKDELTDMLFAEFPELFGSCVPHTTRTRRDGEVHGEDYFFTTAEDMASRIDVGDFIEAGKYMSYLYGTSFDSLQDVMREGRICILDVSAHAIEQLKLRDIHPIVIFVNPTTLDVVKTQNPQLDEDTASTVFDLANEVFRDFRPQFTEIVYNEDISETYHSIIQVIRQHSKEPYWAAKKDQTELATLTA